MRQSSGGMRPSAAAVYGRYSRHRGAVLAGGLAFFGMLSLVPSMLTLGALLALRRGSRAVSWPTCAQAAGGAPGGSRRAGSGRGRADDASPRAAPTSLGRGRPRGPGLLALRGQPVRLRVPPGARHRLRGGARPPSLLARGVSIVITIVFQVAHPAWAWCVLSVVPRVLDRLGLGDLYASNVVDGLGAASQPWCSTCCSPSGCATARRCAPSVAEPGRRTRRPGHRRSGPRAELVLRPCRSPTARSSPCSAA